MLNVWAGAGFMFLSLLLSVASIASPTSQPTVGAVPTLSSGDEATEKLLDHRLPRVGLLNVSLDDCIDYLRDVTGANIYADWKAVGLAGVGKDFRVTVDATDIPFRQALKKILDGTGSTALDFNVINGVIVVSTKLNFEDRKTRVGPYLPKSSDPQSAVFLDKQMDRVELPLISFADAIDYLRDVSGDSILVNWQALMRMGIDKGTQVTLSLHNAPFSSVLYFLLDQTGDGKLGYTTQPCVTMQYDKTLRKPVPKPSALITISTIDDLVTAKNKPTTQPG